jgi:hypothetical protein
MALDTELSNAFEYLRPQENLPTLVMKTNLGRRRMSERTLRTIVRTYAAAFLLTGLLLVPLLESLFALGASAQGSAAMSDHDAAIFALLALTCLALFALAAWGVWRRAPWGRIAGAVASSMCTALLCIVALGLFLSATGIVALLAFGAASLFALAAFQGVRLFGGDARVRALFPEGM